jgi:hypothetical protein
MKKSGLIAVSLIFALPLFALFGGCGEDSGTCTCDLSELEGLVSALEAQVTTLQAELTTVDGRLTTAEGSITALESNSVLLLAPYLTISSGTINGLAGPHVIFEGVNVHIRNGDDATETFNGVGNLVVGYNEGPTTLNPFDRGGSHNLIVGPEHKYLSCGGFLAGFRNTLSGYYTSVSGGYGNEASGNFSSVSGGVLNTASGNYSSVSGGRDNTASGWYCSVSGGEYNEASGLVSSVSGGNTTRPATFAPASAVARTTRPAVTTLVSAGGMTML